MKIPCKALLLLHIYIMNDNNDYTVCIKHQIISYLLFRCTLQDVRITHLETENNTKELKRQKKHQFIIYY